MSRAEDLPEEILDRILYFVANDSYHSAGGVVNKEGLCSCSLTCRYWSRRTVPPLFDTISLRSQEDLKILVDLLATSQRQISPHIRSLHVLQAEDFAQPPWIHRALLTLANKLPGLCEMIYSDAETRPKIHPHPLLPKRLPAFFTPFCSLGDLWLQDNHFHSFSDLVHLIGRLPHLKTLSCARITWTHQPQRMPASRARLPSRLATVHFLGCQSIWPIVWLFMAPAASSHAPNGSATDTDASFLCLDENNVRVITDVTRCFLSHEKMETSTFILEWANQHTGHLQCTSNKARMRPDEPRSDEPCAPDITFYLAPPDNLPSSLASSESFTPPIQLQAIEFDRFRDGYNPYRTDKLSLSAWDGLEKILSEARMTTVRLMINLPAEHMSHITAYEQLQDAILAKMPSRQASAEDDGLFRRPGWQEVIKAHSRT